MDFAELTTSPIDITYVSRRIVPPECGATVTLDGYARKFTKQKDGSAKETEYLVYEAYEPMAIKEMEKLIAAAKERFEISHVGIVHRTGRLEIGETSVVISVAAPHRRAAFEACEWLIKELKRTVPIWKKEVYSGGEQWIEGDLSSTEIKTG
ncbi:MAG: molybdenum cofactor biosynthesis protein MoaE [Pyrinomonadaceae bacterium]